MQTYNFFGNDIVIDDFEISYMGFTLRFGIPLIICCLIFLLICYILFINVFGSFDNGIDFIENQINKFLNYDSNNKINPNNSDDSNDSNESNNSNDSNSSKNISNIIDLSNN